MSLAEAISQVRRGTPNDVALRVRDLVVGFRLTTILDRVSFEVTKGEIRGSVAASRAGKSVLLRTIIGFIQPRAGSFEVFGRVVSSKQELQKHLLERHWGILYQQGALFS